MRWSLSVKITVVIVVLVTVGGGLTSAFVFKSSRSSLESQIKKNQLQLAQQTMDKLDRFLYERRIDIQTFSTHGQLINAINSPTADNLALASKDLSNIKTFDAVWSDLSLLDKTGKTLVSTSSNDQKAGVLQEDASLMPIYNRVINGQIAYTDLFKTKDTAEPVLVFMAPMRSNNGSSDIIGVAEGELAWPAAQEIINSVKDNSVSLINSAGYLIGSSNSEGEQGVLSTNFQQNSAFKNIEKRSDGSTIQSGLNSPGVSNIVSYVAENGYLEYTGNRWFMVLETPAKVASSPSRDLALRLMIPFLVILLVSVGIFLVILNWILLKPLTSVRQALGQIGQGDFSLGAPITSRDEIGELAQGVNDMAGKIQDAYAGLRLRTEQAEEQQQINHTLLENLPVGVLVIKISDGKVIMANKAAARISGKRHEDILNQDFMHAFEVVKDDGGIYPSSDRPLAIAIRSGKSCLKDDLYIRQPDGLMIATRTIASPIIDKHGHAELAVSVFEDITKEKNLERSREEFFSIASHELRTPLTAIRGNSDMIQQYYGEQLKDPELKEMVGDIHESANRLIEIVNDFLDTSRLEQKRMKYNIESIDVVELAKSVIKEYHVTSSRQKIALEIQEPAQALPLVYADRNRTKQVLINLVGNALKFTDDGGVHIYFEVDNDFVKTFIKDTGKGMAPDAQKLLFRKFEQTGSSVITRDSVRGTGLGLYISKLIIEQMHGHIQLESSAVGRGTTFSFSLPIAANPQVPITKHVVMPGHPPASGQYLGINRS